MPYFQNNDVNMYYVIDQSEISDAETIVLIHTNIMDHTIYDVFIPILTRKFNVVRYDLRGFGASDLGNEELTLDVYIEDLKCLITSLDLQAVHLVGFGFGALMALKFSTRYGQFVKKMILMTMACFPEEFYASLREHRERISEHGTKVPVETIIRKVTSLTHDDPQYRRLMKMISKVPPATYKEIMDLTLYTNPIPYMEKTETPTMILSAEREVVFPQHLLAYMASQLPIFHYAVVPNSSSFLMIDQPLLTTNLMTAFLSTEKQPLYTEDDKTNLIYENIRAHTRKMYKNALTNEKTNNDIRVDCLYSFSVIVNEQQLTDGWGMRYAKQMMIYLLFHPVANREQLCGRLWPETPLPIAKKNLRVYLNYLKKLVNGHARGEAIVTADRDYIYLNGHLHSDALSIISNIKKALSEKEGRRKYELVKSIMRELSSPTFLTAIYDDWFLDMRNKVEKDLIELTIWLTEWLMHEKRIEELQIYLNRASLLFEGDPLINDLLKGQISIVE